MAVKLSSKYGIIIPKTVRDSMKLKPGMELDFLTYGNGASLVVVPPIEEMEGFLKGELKGSAIERDEKDRL
jgi:AbrB family looped-hinge helix DNA binding protein